MKNLVLALRDEMQPSAFAWHDELRLPFYHYAARQSDRGRRTVCHLPRFGKRTSNGILWAHENSNPAVLHANNAGDLAQELYNSSQARTPDQFAADNEFITPTVANVLLASLRD